MRIIRTVALAAALGSCMFVPVRQGRAQALGPQRQFIALEPIYSHLQRDVGGGYNRRSLDGYGGRLWINLAPFSGPSSNVIGKTGIGLYSVYSPPRGGISTVHYGAELDVHTTNVPYGLVLDPFVSLGAGVLRTRAGRNNDLGLASGTVNKFALSPGVGLRSQLFNRLQIRGDFRDAIVFSDPIGQRGATYGGAGPSVSGGNTRTTNNLELLASLGITF